MFVSDLKHGDFGDNDFDDNENGDGDDIEDMGSVNKSAGSKKTKASKGDIMGRKVGRTKANKKKIEYEQEYEVEREQHHSHSHK